MKNCSHFLIGFFKLLSICADFKRLQNEVSQITQELAMLSKDVQEIVFSNLQSMLSNRENLNDLLSMVRVP